MAKKKKYDYEIIGRKDNLYIKLGNRIISLKHFNNYVYNGKTVNCDDCPFRSETSLCDISSNDEDCPIAPINEKEVQ